MKRIYDIILCAALLTVTASCEKFFDREPVDEFAVTQFFKSEADLQFYCNGLIDAAMPSAASMALGDDFYCDLAASKESQQFFWPGRFNPSIATGWSHGNFSFIRQVAYMLDNMHNAKANVSEEKYNHYEGVGRFFRAYVTFNRVKKFGDFYWIDHVVDPTDSTILYGPRHDREYVMHKVVEDLAFATEKCLASGVGIKTDGCVYVNKYVALALASRICLYEGTYRKYHSVNPSTGKPWNGEYESAEELLGLALEYSQELVDNGPFELTSDYNALFTSPTLNPKEVIWGHSYSSDLALGHNVTYNYSASTQAHPSPTKDYVMMFLGSDGKPLPSGEISPSKEFENRDKRLTASVLSPASTKKDASGKAIPFNLDFTWTQTGYQWIKWVQAEYSPMSLSSNGSFNSVPVFRYAEVLLNYAEAAAELGQMTEEIWNKTVGELRKVHGGISNSGYPGSAGYVADPWLRQYYTEVKHPVTLSDVLLEIRRERAVELTLEQDSRYQDLMRWNMGDIIARRYKNQGWRGIYISQSEMSSGFMFNGKKYTVSTSKSTSETNYKISSRSDMSWTLSEGTHGYLVYNYELEWDDKMYLYPIPVTAINVNPELRQNQGWQWL